MPVDFQTENVVGPVFRDRQAAEAGADGEGARRCEGLALPLLPYR
jgi:hypothetical protein